MKERHGIVEGLDVYINYNTIISILTKKIPYANTLAGTVILHVEG